MRLLCAVIIVCLVEAGQDGPTVLLQCAVWSSSTYPASGEDPCHPSGSLCRKHPPNGLCPLSTISHLRSRWLFWEERETGRIGDNEICALYETLSFTLVILFESGQLASYWNHQMYLPTYVSHPWTYPGKPSVNLGNLFMAVRGVPTPAPDRVFPAFVREESVCATFVQSNDFTLGRRRVGEQNTVWAGKGVGCCTCTEPILQQVCKYTHTFRLTLALTFIQKVGERI